MLFCCEKDTYDKITQWVDIRTSFGVNILLKIRMILLIVCAVHMFVSGAFVQWSESLLTCKLLNLLEFFLSPQQPAISMSSHKHTTACLWSYTQPDPHLWPSDGHPSSRLFIYLDLLSPVPHPLYFHLSCQRLSSDAPEKAQNQENSQVIWRAGNLDTGEGSVDRRK